MNSERMLLSGNEAVALAARHADTTLGVGYPGTPSTEILENASKIGVTCQWSPNEKVAVEVAIGVAFSGARALCTMKHVGLNVAADPFFTVSYTGVTGGLVIAVADDPGMASSQNEQDSRNYARAAGVPLLEPADSQDAYDMTRLAFELSERWGQPVILRLCTRVCHSKTIVIPREPVEGAKADYKRDIKQRVMIPAYARPAHKRMRKKLAAIEVWNNAEGPNSIIGEGTTLGIIANGVSALHAMEAAPDAKLFKLGMTWPLPMNALLNFIGSVDECVIVEEGDPFIQTEVQAAGGCVRPRLNRYRFGELDVLRIKRILAGGDTDEPVPPKGMPPQLCKGCPHRYSFEVLKQRECIITGDIGCYTLSVLPPFETMDTCVCMGASIGIGLGMRHVLPEAQARKVVSVIGDGTFMHSGLTGIVEMLYNPPKTGHLVIILDNSTTAMTGLQEHAGTGRNLDHQEAEHRVLIEDTLKGLGVEKIVIVDPSKEAEAYAQAVDTALASNDLTVIICRRPCILALARDSKLKRGEKVR